MDKGTIGNRKCEVKLNEILMEINNKKIIHKVCRSILDFRANMKKFGEIRDEGFRDMLMRLYIKSTKEKISAWQLDKVVESHLNCCLSAYVGATRKGTKC